MNNYSQVGPSQRFELTPGSSKQYRANDNSAVPHGGSSAHGHGRKRIYTEYAATLPQPLPILLAPHNQMPSFYGQAPQLTGCYGMENQSDSARRMASA